LEVRNPTEFQSLLSQERVKVTDFTICGLPVHLPGPSEQNPIKNDGEKGTWAYAETTDFYRAMQECMSRY